MILKTLNRNSGDGDYISLYEEHFPYNLRDNDHKKELNEIELSILEKSIQELKLYKENYVFSMNIKLSRMILGYEEPMMAFIKEKRKQLENKKVIYYCINLFT